MTAWLIVIGYILLGIGMARAVAARQIRSYPYADGSDPEIVLPATAAGLFWPLVVPTMLIGPLFVKWWMRPIRKAREVGRR